MQERNRTPVIPAKAGIQVSNIFLRRKFTAWIPAFAGMTVFLALTVFLAIGSLEALDTTIKGGRVELQNNGDVVLFKGGVRLERGRDVLVAEEMETNKKRDKVKAVGNVELDRTVSETERCKGYGKVGYYETNEGVGYLLAGSAQAHVIYTEVLSSTSTRRVDIFANRFDFSKSSSTAVATGKVYGKTIDLKTQDLFEFWSERADYYGEEKKIILSGKKQSLVRQTGVGQNKNIHGDVITYYFETKKVISDGNAQAVFTDEKKGK